MSNYSVLLVIEFPILRRGIAHVIESEPGLTLAGALADRQSAAGAFRKYQPDLALIDLSMKGSADVKVIETIFAHNPKAKIVNLAGIDRKDDIQAVLKAGAKGYIGADATVEELLDCVFCVAEGGKYFAPSSALRLAESMWADALSRREMHILKLLSTGKTNREIGQAAGISEETVKSHVNRILSKLDAASRTEAVVVAVRNGVIRFD